MIRTYTTRSEVSMSVFRTKSVEASMAASEEADHKLKRTLSALDLTVFGIGAIVGGLAALCYAEFASTVPVSGSPYTFSYATLGELIAWIIGWDLLLELMLGASVVAQGWSEYFVTFLGQVGVTWPESVGPGSHFDLPAFL